MLETKVSTKEVQVRVRPEVFWPPTYPICFLQSLQEGRGGKMNFSEDLNLTAEEKHQLEIKSDELAHLKILMVVVPIIVPILFTLVIIIGFIGNILVVLVVLLNKTMRNTTNILIFNLAVNVCK